MVTQNQYAYFLYNVPGLGSRGIFKLLGDDATCEDVYKMEDKQLRVFVKNRLSKEKIAYEILRLKRNFDFESEEKKLRKMGIRFASIYADEFPEKLRNIPDPPFGIYYKGKLPDPNKPSVAIVGARLCSDYGRFMSREFGKGLALSQVQIISGMARGVDGISQKAAIEAGGSSFGVLGCSVDICYPEENRDVYDKICLEGGLISEYHPGTEPKANLFPMRNRIISALSDIVLVVEARQKSGTQITVDQALEQGKEVLAIPGRVTDRLSDGCNFLISQGAGVALSVSDVLDRLWKTGDENELKISDDDENETKDDKETDIDDETEDIKVEKTVEEEIFDSIDIIPISASTIMERLHSKDIDLSIPQLMSNLMELTFHGKIIQEGVYYRRKTG